jgi:hypothetical protein
MGAHAEYEKSAISPQGSCKGRECQSGLRIGKNEKAFFAFLVRLGIKGFLRFFPGVRPIDTCAYDTAVAAASRGVNF